MTAAEELDFSFVPSPPGTEGSQPPGPAFLVVSFDRRGCFQIEGSRCEVEMFLRACAEAGFVIHMDCLNWCG